MKSHLKLVPVVLLLSQVAQAGSLQSLVVLRRERLMKSQRRSRSLRERVLPRPRDVERLLDPASPVHWMSLAELRPGPGGAPEPSPADMPAIPSAPENRSVKVPTPQSEGYMYFDGRVGFDRQVTIGPGFVATVVKRHIYTLVGTAEYPLQRDVRLALSVPYIRQTADSANPSGTLHQTGSGIGDVSLFVEKSFPEVRTGTELAVALGMQFPTGRDPFSLAPTQLPTGTGFYQPLVHVTLSKLRVPLQLYTSFDYGTNLSRTVAGQRVTLPPNYGAEAGFYYSIGPEATSQTALSYSRVSSPLILGPTATVGYLTQALTYRTGGRSSVRGSLDLGLTDASTDLYFGLSLRNSF